ncbi:hypothetical protein [Allorhodopirellula solitaria]|uniref:Cytochrome oxidase complex assembly protein 1 n=1 Tax=Allorhodopirellula solitaria TaxID=2527987 RepID=A0A5C5YJF3_9BACT|nr:hypothetical protein [Allorhodopirellula solitaria]TWT75011.1 hypothetical protein CA85_02990 [Allorhodopirellula solitaria]
MSQDPFQRDTNEPAFAPGENQAPPARKRRKWLWIFAMLLSGGFLTVLVCCGAGLYWIENYGSFVFDPMRDEMNEMAELREQVGEIESLNLNVSATVEEAKANPEFAMLDGQADQGPFQVSVRMTKEGDLEKVFVVMPDGSRNPIDISKRIDPPAVDADQETGADEKSDAGKKTDADEASDADEESDAGQESAGDAASKGAEGTTEVGRDDSAESSGKNLGLQSAVAVAAH